MKYKLVIHLLLLLQITYAVAFAQSGKADRDEYFRRMELRAIELSRKMAELTGSEPVGIIKPRAEEQMELLSTETNLPPMVESSPDSSSGTSVQDSYDALPGPAEDNQTIIIKQYEDKVGENTLFSQSTTEELKGTYYLRPSFVFQAPFESAVNGVNSLDGQFGHGIGVVVGRRIENWTLSARFGHTHQEFSNGNFYLGVPADGDVETLSLTANIGVSVPLNQKLSFEASFGLGFTTVSHSLAMVLAPGINSLDVLSDSGFSYELSLFLDYSFSERLSAFLGYRLTGIPENKGMTIAFDSVSTHLFELGLGINF